MVQFGPSDGTWAAGSICRPRNAVAPGGKVTVAVGLFAGRDALAGVVGRLVGVGFDRMRMVAVLSADASIYPLDSAAELARHARTIVVEPTSGRAGFVRNLVSALAGTCAEDDPIGAAPCPDCGLDKHSAALAEQLRMGGAVLAVRVDDAAQQQSVCRLLLGSGSRGVQTHDLRRRA